MKIQYLLSAVFFLVVACSSRHEVHQEITYENIEKHIVELADNKYKGRAPMSDTENDVVNYIRSQMKEIGLQGANNGSFIQEVPVVSVTSKISDHLVFETPKESLKFNKITDYVTFSRKMESEMSLEKSEVIFAGFGIVAPEYARNDYDEIDVKGKTVLVFVNDPGYGTNSSYFKGNSMTYYGRWTYKFEEAARQGAKACIIVHETGPAGYPWAVVSNNGESTKFYLEPDNGFHDRCSFEGWISTGAAEKLFKACGLSLKEAKEKALKKDFKPEVLSANVSGWIKSTFGTGKSKNVCGLVKGTEKQDEVIVYTAHWDHLGEGTNINGDSIYNGATDNASAVSWMLEIARVAKKNPPKRSMLFLSVTCEESGLLGSSYYVQNPFFPMNKTIACINTDVILFLGRFQDVTVTGYGQSELDHWLTNEAVKQGRYVVPDPNPENGMYFRSDQFPFVKAGVPAIFAKGYTNARDLGKEKTLEAINNYWKYVYHTPMDEYVAERDNLQGLVEDAILLYNVGRNLANSDEWPNWNLDSEFKAVRDASLQVQN